MSREKGTGNLQREKSGRYTARIGMNGKRLSRSTGTKDRGEAEEFLRRMLSPLGLGAERVPLSDAWRHYEMSPNRRDLAPSTLANKRLAWMAFAQWIEHNHMEITQLSGVTSEAVAEYLMVYRSRHSASTYNGHVCILREVFRTLASKAGITSDPWEGVALRMDDSISRREFSLDEVSRLYAAAAQLGPQWRLLVMTGIYTGLRLGDCCRLAWNCVNLERGIIQLIPEKTKRHNRGRPVTIPIHSELAAELAGIPANDRHGFVNPSVAKLYIDQKWRLDDALRRIFKTANITMSVNVKGRARKCVLASFHSLRHTFVSLSANAGVPLPVVQSIVGHCSTAMTRHYYHENEDALRQAIAAIPAFGSNASPAQPQPPAPPSPPTLDEPAQDDIAVRLRRLDDFLAANVISKEEYATIRARILAQL